MEPLHGKRFTLLQHTLTRHHYFLEIGRKIFFEDLSERGAHFPRVVFEHRTAGVDDNEGDTACVRRRCGWGLQRGQQGGVPLGT